MAATQTPVGNVVEPQSYKQAISGPDADKWHGSMKSEYDSITGNNVYELVELPGGKNAISTKWVYKIKLDSENNPIKWKSRFVVRGFSQKPGVDYDLTHSPVASWRSIRLIMSMTAKEDYELFQFDYDTAFLNAKLEEDIYVQQHEGYHKGGLRMVWKLNKALYGLKQTPREWNKTVHQLMIKLGYRNLISDPCVYVKKTHTGRLMMIALYVDDSIVSVHKNDVQEWESDKKKISEVYPIKDLGECNWILNIKVIRDRQKRTITLSQQAYTERIAAKHGLEATRSVMTPAEDIDLWLPVATAKLVELNSKDTTLYQSIVGELLYAANITRPDISFITGRLCQYMAKPYEHQLQAAKRVMRYLSQTAHYCIRFGDSAIAPKDSGLIAFSDSDYGECKETRRSTSGCLVVYNGDIIHWSSRKQKIVTTSTTEAEYVALGEAVIHEDYS